MSYTIEEIEMLERKARELLGWCENEDCGDPIYQGDPHIADVSSVGNRYLYHPRCRLKPTTPDSQLDEF